jgi:hypothetical protein
MDHNIQKTTEQLLSRGDLPPSGRRHRLEALEADIRRGLEEFYRTGMRLKEIRDDELYKEAGFLTWEEYCKGRWEWTAERARQMIVASEYRAVLPAPPAAAEGQTNCWKEGSVRELTRLGSKRDAARVAAKVVKAVEESKKAAAQDPEAKPVRLTASTVRKYVDADLGIDRAAQAQKTKRLQELAEAPEIGPKETGFTNPTRVRRHLTDVVDCIEVEAEMLAAAPEGARQKFAGDNPQLVRRLLVACDAMAALWRPAEREVQTTTRT